MRPYERDPQAIYAASFATVRKEAALDRFPADIAELAVRVIHACGMVEIADRLSYAPDVATSGIAALRAGAPVYADCEMVASGITRRLLPEGTDIRCTLNDPRTADMAREARTTRSAAAVDLWDTDGAIIAIGNAPTALFRLLERLDEGAPKPAARAGKGTARRGRRGGSAMASAAVNALAILAAGGMQ